MDGEKKPEVQSLKNRKNEKSLSLNSYEVKLEAEIVKSVLVSSPKILIFLSFFFLLFLSHLPFSRQVYLDKDIFVCIQQR